MTNRPPISRLEATDAPSDSVSAAASPAMTAPAVLLRQVLAAARIAIWEAWEPGLELIAFTPGSLDVWPLSAAQIAPGSRWDENIYPPDRAGLAAHLRQAGGARPASPIDYRLIVGEGELLWVRDWTLHRGVAGDGRYLVCNAIMPIPEQKHLEWECLRVSERECNRIGQELHDDLCQVLAGLGFMMRVVEQRARKADAALAAEIGELNAHLFGATDRVRSMAHGLFPARLQFTSLRDALTAFAGEVRTLFRVQVVLDLPRSLPRQSAEQIVHVYRIVQEAVSNSVRHGHAETVRIGVEVRGGGIVVRIADDGEGFVAAHARPEGIGIHVMQYRARVLGGTLSHHPISPRGVAVELAYPARHLKPIANSTSHLQP